MGKLIEHAKREFDLAFSEADDDAIPALKADVCELIETFAKQGHSGFTASYCASLFYELANYRPLSPLTNSNEEWEDVSSYFDTEGGTVKTFQNKRSSNVLKTVKTVGKNVKETAFQVDRYILKKMMAQHIRTLTVVTT